MTLLVLSMIFSMMAGVMNRLKQSTSLTASTASPITPPWVSIMFCLTWGIGRRRMRRHKTRRMMRMMRKMMRRRRRRRRRRMRRRIRRRIRRRNMTT